LFFPLGQYHTADTTLIVRADRPQPEIAAALNHLLSSIDSSLPFQLQAWDDQMAFVLFPARVATAALGVMGLLAAMRPSPESSECPPRMYPNGCASSGFA
jgi:hypothetical protein